MFFVTVKTTMKAIEMVKKDAEGISNRRVNLNTSGGWSFHMKNRLDERLLPSTDGSEMEF
jgi:hypothetical protein